ncbi:glycoside hydrolase family 19 protein [Sphingomonas sp. MMS24-J13]|uniref:glycoside hydrolase family 19 protein n=1 Tax=Sphingomonas sp. MMS24-J13 TaxID=3238686 RepID=UPI0038508594
MIDWAKVQAALMRAGYTCGKIDGDPGVKTFTALFAFAADRQPDETIAALGRAGAAWLRDDAICGTPQRLAEFVAQCCNETGGFVRFEEDLRYSAAGMLKTWPTHFTPSQAIAAVGRPIEIASRAYGGRNGNAPYPSRDGYTYRGRGMLQLTGKSNYALYGMLLNLPLLDRPDLAADPADSLLIAREFWRRGRLNDAIDKGDFVKARQITNGGSIGLTAVAAIRARLLQVLA